MQRYKLNTLSEPEVRKLCKRKAVDFSTIAPAVSDIIRNVKHRGDEAVLDYTAQFDGVRPDPLITDVPDAEQIDLPENVKAAFNQAYENILMFHKAQIPIPLTVETMPGVVCRRDARAIESVGLYVPGGTAVLPSTVLMLGVPAQIAGCRQVVMTTPPRPDGSIAPEILYAASLTGIKKIIRAGGAQAIAAMACGTESVPKVHKIFGPGNQYVTCAKMLLQQSEEIVAIDLPAGPSEVLVIADDTANPVFVAIDLLSQAEHGADSQVVLVTTSDKLVADVEKELEAQLADLPRANTARKALENSLIILVDNLQDAIQFSNKWAPEHLIISTNNPEETGSQVTCAGSVFLGHWTPESVGDYASGTNHTLPTSGYARMYSGVSLDSFYTYITFQQLSKEGLTNIGSTVEIMAGSESLEAHKRAVSLRLEAIRKKEPAR